MLSQSLHTGILPARRISAVILVVIYLAIIVSPLAPFALSSQAFAHAFSGECTGDCQIDGCSRESRANHSCCCARKRQQAAVAAQAVPSAGCCAAAQPAAPVVVKRDIFAQKPLQSVIPQSTGTAAPAKNVPVYSCGCPCGKGHTAALSVFGSHELLPISTSEILDPAARVTLHAGHSARLVSRPGDPPDPPPRLPLHS